jgi:hypothetical protein
VAGRALVRDPATAAVPAGVEVVHADQVRTIGEVIGRPVGWQELPPDVADVTGTPARTFRERAVDHAGDFR